MSLLVRLWLYATTCAAAAIAAGLIVSRLSS
jgi:hypothetical protein